MVELKTRTALFNANKDEHQVELIFKLLGAPQGEPLRSQYQALPDFEKCCNARNLEYISKFQQKFQALLEPNLMNLIEGLLCLDPERRLTANEALEHPFFTMTPVQSPAE
jgi:serine/threonine protein kinase